MRNRFATKLLLLGLAAPLCAQLKTLKPGYNLFSPSQDVQLGREAATQVQQKMHVVHNPDIDAYLNNLLTRLKSSPHAGRLNGTEFPFAIALVYDKSINAFALPGGPLFVHTGLIQACENEAQLAGVIGHEMSHIVLRHSTNQMTKQNFLQLPAMLAGAVAGDGMLGSLAKGGVQLFAGGLALKFSRTDEAQADYNGALIAADAGYNPLEMAHFFEKLEKQTGKQGTLSQLLSDHPNPGNRVAAVESEIRQMPQRDFSTDSGQFAHIQDVVNHLQPPGNLTTATKPSAKLIPFRNSAFSLSYPDNWQVFGGDKESSMVTIAPHEGVIRTASGVAIGYGLEVSYYLPPGDNIEINRDTQALIRQLIQQNSGMSVASPTQGTQIAAQRALITTLSSRSPFQGQSEIDTLVTVPRPEGLFYLLFIAPQIDQADIDPIIRQVIASVRFP